MHPVTSGLEKGNLIIITTATTTMTKIRLLLNWCPQELLKDHTGNCETNRTNAKDKTRSFRINSWRREICQHKKRQKTIWTFRAVDLNSNTGTIKLTYTVQPLPRLTIPCTHTRTHTHAHTHTLRFRLTGLLFRRYSKFGWIPPTQNFGG